MAKDNKQENKAELAGESVNSREERTLKFWQDNKIFEKSLEKESPKGEFVFYDGPPFATGLPHYGHLLAGTIKDIIPRYKTMKGFHVDRKWGWDCHGLPIENLIEAELGLKTKKDIEDLGIAKFNAAAKASVLRYEKDWRRIIPRVGRFVDMDSDYKTMDSSYTESIWWIFKDLYDKNFIYEGYKAMHLCPRCETTLANFEVNQGYKDITDISLVGKFELTEEPGTFVLAWTTTPWTLPGNVALAVNPEIEYSLVEAPSGKYILASNKIEKFFAGEKTSVARVMKGEALIGKGYKPLYDYYSDDKDLKNHKNGWKIYGADFVTIEDGTGVVHIAPAFGEDDMTLGVKENLPFVQHVGTDGRFRKEVQDFAGLQVKPKDNKESGADHQSTDIEVIKNLAHRGLLFAKEKLIHSYPHCWRCDTPLLNYASSSWFVKVTEFKNRLIKNNEKTNWVPENIRDGRFGKWLEGARDWAISRSRYWGAPLPVWRCADCKKIKVIGSVEDLKKENPPKNKYFLLRHGEAESTVKNVFSCSPDEPNSLTEKGRAEVLESTNKLEKEKIDIIFSSDFVRTKETAEIVAETLGYDKSKIIFDIRLREINAGSFNCKPITEYQEFFSTMEERFTKTVPGGENATDIKKRVMEFLAEIDSKYVGKNILIVSHGDPIWLMTCGSSGCTAKESADVKRDIYVPTGHCSEIVFSPFPHNESYELDFHRPYIDEIKFVCECGGSYKRVPEVFDCWFESGAMPYASVHYPFENKEKFEANFPADFIAEGLDQTRGWFYSLMVLSTALFDQPTFEQVVVNGMVLAEDGQKMSKRLKNYPDTMYIVEKYGADALRYYMINSPIVRAEDLRFSERGVDEVNKKLILKLLNVLSFYELYSGGGELGGSTSKEVEPPSSAKINVLDLWIKESLHKLTEEVEHNLKKYELDKAVRPLLDFVDEFSTWYIRRSRDRFKSEDLEDRSNAIRTTRYILKELSKIIAPITPFVAEEVYSKVKETGDKMSVHLEEWPFYGVVHEDELSNKKKVLEDMAEVRRLVSLALDERKKAGISVRQPLQKLSIKSRFDLSNRGSSAEASGDEKLKSSEYLGGLLELIMDEVNVKEVIFDEKIEGEVSLDTFITPDLKEEGNLRELVRYIQDARKNMGLTPSQKIRLNFSVGPKEKVFLEKFSTELKKSVTAESTSYLEAKLPSGEDVKIGEMVFSLVIEK